MAHLLKLNKGNSTRVMGHCFREKKDGYIKYHSGSEIDPERSIDNVYLGSDDGEDFTVGEANPQRRLAIHRFENRMKEVGVKRKDQVVLCDWVFTVPKTVNLTREQEQDLLGHFASFVSERYGEANFIYGTMHFDETTPHIHCGFTPVLDGKFNAKKLVSRTELNRFHEDFYKYLSAQNLEYTITLKDILSGKTKEQGGNKSVSELKAMSKQEVEEISLPSGTRKMGGKTVFSESELNTINETFNSLKETNLTLYEQVEAAHNRKERWGHSDASHWRKYQDLIAEREGLIRERDTWKAKAEPDKYEVIYVPEKLNVGKKEKFVFQIEQDESVELTAFEKMGSGFSVFIEKAKNYVVERLDGFKSKILGSDLAEKIKTDVAAYSNRVQEQERQKELQRQRSKTRKIDRSKDYDDEL